MPIYYRKLQSIRSGGCEPHDRCQFCRGESPPLRRKKSENNLRGADRKELASRPADRVAATGKDENGNAEGLDEGDEGDGGHGKVEEEEAFDMRWIELAKEQQQKQTKATDRELRKGPDPASRGDGKHFMKRKTTQEKPQSPFVEAWWREQLEVIISPKIAA
jgi:hypothetical protein